MRAAFAAVLVAAVTVAADDKPAKPPEGFVALYNGTDLKGWKATGKVDQWSAEPGLIACKGAGGGWLLTEAEYADFELRFEYRWTKEGGNSGVAIRTLDKGDPSQVGLEIQLIDDENWAKVHKFELKDYQHTGSVYGLAPAKGRKNNPVGEWNAVRVACKGDAVTVEQNGTELVSADLAELRKKSPKHAGVQRAKGHVGFQSYNSRVEFRNVYLKEVQ